jgi:hypothetical protein
LKINFALHNNLFCGCRACGAALLCPRYNGSSAFVEGLGNCAPVEKYVSENQRCGTYLRPHWHCNLSIIIQRKIMKTTLTMLAAVAALSFSSFAAAQTPAAAPAKPMAPAPAAMPAPAAAPAAAPMAAPGAKMTSAEYKAAKKQVKADEKMAKAECKKLKGADKSACKKEAEAKEKSAMADLKARK